MHSWSVIMGIFLANRDAPLRFTATDCLVQFKIVILSKTNFKFLDHGTIMDLVLYLEPHSGQYHFGVL